MLLYATWVEGAIIIEGKPIGRLFHHSKKKRLMEMERNEKSSYIMGKELIIFTDGLESRKKGVCFSDDLSNSVNGCIISKIGKSGLR